MLRKRRKKSKYPDSTIIGYRGDVPIVSAWMGEPYGGSYPVRVVCPHCGWVNAHGIPKGSIVAGLHHRVADCGCFLRGYYFQVVPSAVKESA